MLNTFISFLAYDCNEDNCALPCSTIEYLHKIVVIIRVVAPIITIVLIAKDIFTAATAGKEEDMKKAQKAALIRIIILVIIFFAPTVVNIVVNMADLGNGCKFAGF